LGGPGVKHPARGFARKCPGNRGKSAVNQGETGTPAGKEHDGAAHSRKTLINIFIWCGVGALVGWAMGVMMQSGGRILLIENMAVAVFGAFVGGDFVVAVLNHGVVKDKDFHISSLAFAVTGAVVMVLLLKLMRHAVGPMRAGKPKAGRRG
jgi:uncharacterized membrane protein YeaQ/YmgE (transglycosylase-associated protein family)